MLQKQKHSILLPFSEFRVLANQVIMIAIEINHFLCLTHLLIFSPKITDFVSKMLRKSLYMKQHEAVLAPSSFF